NFGEYINCLCEELNLDREYIIKAIKRWYNGNRFALCKDTLYNPVSVGKLFSNLRFENYWAQTGSPRFLIDQYRNNPFGLEERLNKWTFLNNSPKYDLKNLDGMDIAYQAGYLAITDWRQVYEQMQVKYDFPNQEIRDSWNLDILTLANHQNESQLKQLMATLFDNLEDADIDTFMQNIEWFFSGIPYENAGEITEGYFRNQLRTLFVLFGIPNQCEVQQSRQRTDIAAQTRKMALVFELKMMKESATDKENECARLLKEAIEQGRNKHYIDKYKAESEIVKGVAMVFDEQTRRVKAWKVWE
ncbi:MAG: ATP-binding protein, partial [Bacteroidales bacterium]|nr:ATP-binding protein [Bacteroidales bacterium]